MAVATSTLLIASLAATAVGTGVSAYNQYQAGKAQQSLSNYNAAVSDQAAVDTARDGRIAANAQRAQNERLKARQRALYAKAGVSIATGSPLMVQVEQAGELEMAALEQEQQANSQAAKLRQQAVLDRMQGSAAKKAGGLNAMATVLQGAGQATQTGIQYNHYKGVS
jgi:hypothetical protein